MFAATRREYRSLPAIYWTIWLGTLINKSGGFVVPFLALYIVARGGSEAQAGLVMALYGGGAILAGVTGGLLADHVGRRATMLLSLLGGAVAMLGIGLSQSLPSICATTFLMGWVAELYRPAAAAATADLVSVADRTRAYSHLYWANNLGFVIAPTLGGLVASRSYFAIFVVDAATMAAYGVLVLLRVPETRPRAEPVASAEGLPPAGLRTIVRDRTFMFFLLLMLGLTLVMWQDRSALPLDMRRHGIDEATYGYLFCVNGLLIVLLQPRLTRLLSLHPRTAVLAVGSLLFGIGYGLCGLVAGALGYLVAIIMWTFGEMVAIPTASAVVADLAPTDQRGRYQGMFSMSFGVASCVGPLVGVTVLDQAGGRVLWLGCFVLMLSVTIGHLLLGPARAAREREHEAACT